MTINQPTSTEPPAAPRADLEAICRDEAIEAAARFLGVLHDTTFHYGEDVSPLTRMYGYDDALVVILDVIGGVKAAAEKAEAQIKTSAENRAWVTSGAPLRCGCCGGEIDLGWDTWRVCAGWAEHEHCHEDDAAEEAKNRGWTVGEDEYQAHLDERNHRTGPLPGDRVRRTFLDGSTIEGTWEHPAGSPMLRLDDDTVHEVTAHATLEVIELREADEDTLPGVPEDMP